MNTPIEISNLTDYISQIDKITRPEITYLYRGQENEVWRVTSSAYRRLEKQVDADPDLLDDLFVGYVKQADESFSISILPRASALCDGNLNAMCL